MRCWKAELVVCYSLYDIHCRGLLYDLNHPKGDSMDSLSRFYVLEVVGSIPEETHSSK